MKITALINVWNSGLWLPYTIRGIYDFADSIVITESCWVPGDWSGITSPDGTADIIRKFQETEDPQGKVSLHQAGIVKNQPEGRNSGLHLVPEDTDWVYMVDCDEFYMPEDLRFLRKAMERPGFSKYSTIIVPAKCFYFDFTYYKVEPFVRGYRWFPGQRFWAIASMVDLGGTQFDVGKLGFQMYHYSYVSTEWTRMKACMGEDLPEERYRKWWDEVYSKFDGNLDKVYEKNKGGVHVNGGGEVDRYYGPHPPVLDSHPLRNWEWGKNIEGP